MTEIARKDLIRHLETVSPAVAQRDLVPQLAMFWFTGSAIMAYNGEIAISVPCETDFAGAVPKTLLSLLNNSRIPKLSMTAADNELNIKSVKSSKSKFKLSLRPAEDFVFEMPKMGDVPVLNEDKSAELFAGMSGCMRSLAGARSPVADQLGITVIPNGKAVDFYATNAATISKCSLPINLQCAKRVILPEAFCKQALDLGKGAKLKFMIGDDHALMLINDGSREVSLFGMLLESEQPYDFDKIIEHHFPASMQKRIVEVPKDLRLALERAFVLVGKRMTSQFSVSDNKLKIVSKADVGEVRDTLTLGKPQGEMTANFEPELLLAGVSDKFDHLMIASGCCVMTSKEKGQLYLVAASNK